MKAFIVIVRVLKNMAATRNGTSDGIGEQNATDMEAIVISKLGEKQKDLFTGVLLTIVYVIIFLTGSVGNLTTCLILRKRVYLHTVTNIYLLNLAIADLLTIVLGKNLAEDFLSLESLGKLILVVTKVFEINVSAPV